MLGQPIAWFIKLAIARLRAQWRAILTVIIGVLLTTIIGASAPLYTSAIAQVGLEQRLSQHPNEDVNIFMRLGLGADSDDFTAIRADYDRVVTDTIAQSTNTFGRWHDKTVTWAESVTMNVVRDGDDIENAMLRVAHYDALDQYAELVAGEWMTDQPAEGVHIEIALAQSLADHLSLTVGDVIVLEQRGWDRSLPITAQISALFAPRDHDENYWMNPSPIRIERSGATIQSNVLLTRSAFDRILAEFIPQTRAQTGWRVLFNHNRLAYSDIVNARSAISGLQNAIRSSLEAYTGERTQVIYQTDLPNAIGSYGGEVKRLGAPFTLFLSQLGALVLFFLVVMGELVRRNERREIGMLKARGVRDSQLILLRGMETLIICILSVLVAPFIARQLLIALTPLFTSVESIPLAITLDAFLYAGIAGFIALIVLVGTLIPVLRSPLILTSGMTERSQGVAWWQRYYLDVILLIVGIGAFIQLGSTRTLTSGDDQALSDPLLLLMPTLLIFALGSVALRLFPVFVNIMAGILGRRTSLAGALAGWQVSREPSHYGRITFLLALAISIGWFALSFQRTVTISQDDRALYHVGSDVRISYNGTDGAIVDAVQVLDGVQTLSDVIRYENISTTRGTFNLNLVKLLAVDSQTLDDVIYWREAWGDTPLDDTRDTLPKIGEALPIIPDKITLRGLFRSMYFSDDGEMAFNNDPILALSTPIFLILNDDAGQVFTVRLTTPEMVATPAPLPEGLTDEQIASIGEQGLMTFSLPSDDDWSLLEADLTGIRDQIQGELRLQAITIEAGFSGNSRVIQPRSVYLRDLTLVDGQAEETALDWLSMLGWEFVNIRDSQLYPSVLDEQTAPDLLERSLNIHWTATSQLASFSLTLNYTPRYTLTRDQAERPNDGDIVGIPARISQSMADQQNITVGQNFEMLFNGYGVWFEAIAINDYFPTLYGDEAPFVVVDADALNYVLAYLNGGTLPETPHELWVRLAPSTDLDTLSDQLTSFTDQPFTITDVLRSDTIKNTIQTDLLAIGLIGLLIFSAIIGFLLSLVGLLTYASLAVQARRTEFAVLRALGFSTSRIILSMAIEQTFVIITSIILGVLIGLLLSTQVLPVLSIDTTGRSLVPPFHIQIDGLLLLGYIGGIVLILLIQLLISSLLVSRLTTTQALRQPSE